VDAELLVTSVNLDGDGVAIFQGRPVAVPGAIPGERVAARLQRGRDGSVSGEVARILVASPHRVTPRCRHAGPCGGCAWQHIAYAEQLRLKQRVVQDLLDPETPPRVVVRPTLGTPAPGGGTPWGFRDKVS
jgi:23S rRNA (uracil1939-C5)-methyltransferase